MNGRDFTDSPTLFMEIGESSWKVLHGEAGLEMPFDRQENGRLSGPNKEHIVTRLQTFLKRQGQPGRHHAWCAIQARGVSLRRLTIPTAPKEELHRLLSLQIENEFPLAPDELAWGFRELDKGGQSSSGVPGRKTFLIAAVKKETVGDYADILAQCGLNVSFTLAALARSYVWSQSNKTGAALDIGRQHSELLCFQDGVPASVRLLAWGDESVTDSVGKSLGIDRHEAGKLLHGFDWRRSSATEKAMLIESAVRSSVPPLQALIKAHGSASRLYLTGHDSRQADLAGWLARNLDSTVEAEAAGYVSGDGRSAAILGLKQLARENGQNTLLFLQVQGGKAHVKKTPPALRKWAARAVVLLLVCISLPYAEAFFLKARLSRKLDEVKVSRGRLSLIDRELGFFRFLKKSQPPYVDATYLMANAAPPGTRFDSISMNRRGEVSLKGSMKDSQQVLQFRSKLIDSGFFSSVVVEEQTPTPDRQKLIVRMTAQWKQQAARENLKIGPSAEEMEKIKLAAKEIGVGSTPMTGAPFPAGGPLPPRVMSNPAGIPAASSPRTGGNSPASGPTATNSNPVERKE